MVDLTHPTVTHFDPAQGVLAGRLALHGDSRVSWTYRWYYTEHIDRCDRHTGALVVTAPRYTEPFRVVIRTDLLAEGAADNRFLRTEFEYGAGPRPSTGGGFSTMERNVAALADVLTARSISEPDAQAIALLVLRFAATRSLDEPAGAKPSGEGPLPSLVGRSRGQ